MPKNTLGISAENMQKIKRKKLKGEIKNVLQ